MKNYRQPISRDKFTVKEIFIDEKELMYEAGTPENHHIKWQQISKSEFKLLKLPCINYAEQFLNSWNKPLCKQETIKTRPYQPLLLN